MARCRASWSCVVESDAATRGQQDALQIRGRQIRSRRRGSERGVAAMALVKLALTFAIVAWYRGDWVRARSSKARARVRRRARETRRRRARGIDPARAPLEWTVEDGTDTSAHGRLARERRAILERAKSARARASLGAGAARRMAEKLESSCAPRRDKRRFAGGAGRRRDERCDARRARRGAEGALAAAAERHALVRERVRQRRREVGDAASATPR